MILIKSNKITTLRIYSWKSFSKNLSTGIKILATGILLAIILRIFVLSSFHIPTPSMEPSVLAGDYIIVNKLAYGARIVKNFNFMKGGKFETFRVKGFGKVKRNDVIVFNFPYSDWMQQAATGFGCFLPETLRSPSC
ncbi:hypothetical protein FACS189426_01060 [Bacteroidia bacterium]|nr:hypothetical protein FACS189426_01060 [Bacteroidia bacterium]